MVSCFYRVFGSSADNNTTLAADQHAMLQPDVLRVSSVSSARTVCAAGGCVPDRRGGVLYACCHMISGDLIVTLRATRTTRPVHTIHTHIHLILSVTRVMELEKQEQEHEQEEAISKAPAGSVNFLTLGPLLQSSPLTRKATTTSL